jgi:transcription initiation factor TFIIIB Brf1 subunit/transcription initiation factor TFIIB
MVEQMTDVEKIINDIIKNSKKYKNEEEQFYYLISHNVCPKCHTSTIAHKDGDTYCEKCGVVWDTFEAYYSHGTTMETGNRSEIYVPPTNLSAKASPTRSFVSSRNLSSKNKEKFRRLSQMDFYIKAGQSENVNLLRNLKRIVSLLSHNQALYDKHIIEETALLIQNDVQKYLGEKKKTNVYTIMVLTFMLLHLPIDKKLLYETSNSQHLKTFAHFKKNINRGIEEIMKKLPEAEKINIKKKLIEQIAKQYKIKYNEKILDLVYKKTQEIINLAPNNGLENAARAIFEINKYNKLHIQFIYGKHKDKIEKIMKNVNLDF